LRCQSFVRARAGARRIYIVSSSEIRRLRLRALIVIAQGRATQVDAAHAVSHLALVRLLLTLRVVDKTHLLLYHLEVVDTRLVVLVGPLDVLLAMKPSK